ncbi:HNH endonuclease signature motif containing protein [Spirochaetota bacterium]
MNSKSLTLTKQIQLILTEGRNTGSHKFAFLRAIIDYIVEKGPDNDKDVNIPLVYFVEKFYQYFWVMHFLNTKQLTGNSQFKFYNHLETLKSKAMVNNRRIKSYSKKHIYDILMWIKQADKLDQETIKTINRARRIIYDGPVFHTRKIFHRDGDKILDFYRFPDRGPRAIKNASNYKSLFENENFYITIKGEYITEVNDMYYWFDKSILYYWALFTDKRCSDDNLEKPTGLSLLEIPDPFRENLDIYHKHFKSLGINNCVYCNMKRFTAIDHVIPWSIVKNDQFWNMLPICNTCNSSKSNRIIELTPEGKKTLKQSIKNIVNNIENKDVFNNQVKYHFIVTGKDYLVDKNKLSSYLYDLTLNKVDSLKKSFF